MLKYFAYAEPLVDMKQLKKQLVDLIKTNCTYGTYLKELQNIQQQEKIITKYIWLIEKYNEACMEIRNIDYLGINTIDYSAYAIDYDLKMNPILLKVEAMCRDR